MSMAAVAAQDTTVSQDSSRSSPYASSATSHSFIIRIPCVTEGKCRIHHFEYQSRYSSDLRFVLDIESMRQQKFTVGGLESNTEYEVNTTVKFMTPNSPNKKGYTKVWTCPKKVPALRGLRAARTGPGWLDIRWPTLRDKRCPSDIYYLARYKSAKAQNFSESRRYGRFKQLWSVDEWVFRPTHPCEGWNGEFCLLLTDEVRPGENHSVEVQPVRFDPQNETALWDESEAATLEPVLANANEAGQYVLGARDALTPCSPRGPPAQTQTPMETRAEHGAGAGRGFAEQPLHVPAWAIALAVVVLLLALAVFIAARFCHRWRAKKHQLTGAPPPTSSPSASSPAPHTSIEYDDCMSATHMGLDTLPGHGLAQHSQPPLYERLKTLQGRQGAPPQQQQQQPALPTVQTAQKVQTPPVARAQAQAQAGRSPSGMQHILLTKTLATAAAAKASGAPEPINPGNHYVAMGGHTGHAALAVHAQDERVYDDAQSLRRSAPAPTYINAPRGGGGELRESDLYVDPGSPIYEDPRASDTSEGYSRPQQVPPDPWKAWH